MKKNYMDSMEYLIAQEKKLEKERERMKYIETQGKLMKTVLDSFENCRREHLHILDVFYRSSIRLPVENNGGKLVKRVTKEIYSLGRCTPELAAKQLMTQEEIREKCASIRKDTDNPDGVEYAVIDFREGTLLWQEMIFVLGNSVVEMDVMYDGGNGFDMKAGNRPDAVAYMHKVNNRMEAYLMSIGPEGKAYYYVLEKFSLLSLLNMTDRDGYVPDDEAIPTSDQEGDKDSIVLPDTSVGFFTMFDKKKNVFFATEY